MIEGNNDKPKGYGTIRSNTDGSKISMKMLTVLNIFHKFGLWFLVFCSIGVYIGVTVTKNHYKTRMKESIEIGAFMFDQKVYTIMQK